MPRPLLGIVAAALLVAACGGSSTPSSGDVPGATRAASAASPGPSADPGPSGDAAAIDACSVLDGGDIKALTGYGVATAAPGPVMGVFANGCEWTLDGGAQLGAPATLTLGLLEPGGRAAWDRNFAPFLDEPGREVVDGLGEGAFTETADALTLVSGDALVSLQYLDGVEGDPATLVAIGRRIVEALAGR